MRDPDGHYIEFCSCETLEGYLLGSMKKHSQIFKSGRSSISEDGEESKSHWNVGLTGGLMRVSCALLLLVLYTHTQLES